MFPSVVGGGSCVPECSGQIVPRPVPTPPEDRTMAHEGLHEPAELLDEATIDRHRALASVIEELEAIDWYDQRVRATNDPELASILAHDRDDEKEHAAM